MADSFPSTDREWAIWSAAEISAIREIVCRVHPKGGDALDDFWQCYKSQSGKWPRPPRACGAWLAREIYGDDDG